VFEIVDKGISFRLYFDLRGINRADVEFRIVGGLASSILTTLGTKVDILGMKETSED
jgi:hypothetical protein